MNVGELVETQIEQDIQPWADWSVDVSLGLASLMAVVFVIAFTVRFIANR